MPGLRPRSLAHFSESVPAIELEVRYSPPIFSRIPSNNGSTLDKNDCGGRPPHLGFHIHLCPMAQMLRFTFAGSVTPVSVAATMSQCSSAVAKLSRLSGLCRSQCNSLANPHSWEYTPPHHSIPSNPSACAQEVIS